MKRTRWPGQSPMTMFASSERRMAEANPIKSKARSRVPMVLFGRAATAFLRSADWP